MVSWYDVAAYVAIYGGHKCSAPYVIASWAPGMDRSSSVAFPRIGFSIPIQLAVSTKVDAHGVASNVSSTARVRAMRIACID